MSKFLPEMSIDEFRKSLPKLSFSQLKSLIVGLYEWKRKLYGQAIDSCVRDLERKETLICSEMQRRGYKLTTNDYIQWIRALQNKAKKVYISVGKKPSKIIIP